MLIIPSRACPGRSHVHTDARTLPDGTIAATSIVLGERVERIYRDAGHFIADHGGDTVAATIPNDRAEDIRQGALWTFDLAPGLVTADRAEAAVRACNARTAAENASIRAEARAFLSTARPRTLEQLEADVRHEKQTAGMDPKTEAAVRRLFEATRA